MPRQFAVGSWGRSKPPIGTPLAPFRPPGPVGAFWTLSDASGIVTRDATGFYPGELAAGAAFAPGGIRIATTGTTNGGQISLSPTYPLAANCSFTYWWYGWWEGISSGNPGFWRTASGFGNTIALISGSTLKPWLRVAGSDIIRDVGTSAVPTTRPCQIAFTWDDATQTGRTYLDGAVNASATTSGVHQAAEAINPFGWQSGTDQWITGVWYSHALWPRALTAAEIASLQAVPYGVFSPPASRRFYLVPGAAPPPATAYPAALLMGM